MRQLFAPTLTRRDSPYSAELDLLSGESLGGSISLSTITVLTERPCIASGEGCFVSAVFPEQQSSRAQKRAIEMEPDL